MVYACTTWEFAAETSACETRLSAPLEISKVFTDSGFAQAFSLYEYIVF
jgi:hypothetical protein